MSRSYRKHAIFAYEKDSSEKKHANRRVRRSKDVLNGSDYRKLYSSRLIKFGRWGYLSEEEYVRANLPYLRSGETERDLRKTWRKHFLSK